MRGGHCLKVWTKKQQVVSWFTAERVNELYAAVKTASEELGIFRAWRRTWETVGKLNLSKSEKIVTKRVGAHVNPADLVTKPLPRPKN